MLQPLAFPSSNDSRTIPGKCTDRTSGMRPLASIVQGSIVFRRPCLGTSVQDTNLLSDRLSAMMLRRRTVGSLGPSSDTGASMRSGPRSKNAAIQLSPTRLDITIAICDDGSLYAAGHRIGPAVGRRVGIKWLERPDLAGDVRYVGRQTERSASWLQRNSGVRDTGARSQPCHRAAYKQDPGDNRRESQQDIAMLSISKPEYVSRC
jgi:hypothetical protein